MTDTFSPIDLDETLTRLLKRIKDIIVGDRTLSPQSQYDYEMFRELISERYQAMSTEEERMHFTILNDRMLDEMEFTDINAEDSPALDAFAAWEESKAALKH